MLIFILYVRTYMVLIVKIYIHTEPYVHKFTYAIKSVLCKKSFIV